MSANDDIENNRSKKSRSRSKGKKIKKGKRDDKEGAIEDIALPNSFKEYGIPTDIGKRVVNFSDVDKSVYNGVTSVPFLPTPWNYILAGIKTYTNKLIYK